MKIAYGHHFHMLRVVASVSTEACLQQNFRPIQNQWCREGRQVSEAQHPARRKVCKTRLKACIDLDYDASSNLISPHNFHVAFCLKTKHGSQRLLC